MKNNVYAYIDAANMWGVYKSKGKVVEYAKFTEYIKKRFSESKISFYHYESYPANETREYNTAPKHNFHTYLKKDLKFTVKKKKLKIIKDTDKSGHTIKREKGNMDVEITADVVMHNQGGKNTIILCSGDSDFAGLVNTLKGMGNKVIVWSGKNNISWELKNASDEYEDLLNIPNIWGGDLKHRKIR